MIVRWIGRSCRTAWTGVAPRVQAWLSRRKGPEAAVNTTVPPVADGAAQVPRPRRKAKSGAMAGTALNLSPVMTDIMSEREELLGEIAWVAEQGVVLDGLPQQLLASHEAELAEHRRLLAEDHTALQAGLRRLDAAFPAPPPPVPEPPVPPRPRRFPPLGELLAQRPRRNLH